MKHGAGAYRKMSQETNTSLGEILRIYDSILHNIALCQLMRRLDDQMSLLETAKSGLITLLLSLDLEQGEIAESLAAIYKYILKLLGTDFVQCTEENKQLRLQESYQLLETLLHGWRPDNA